MDAYTAIASRKTIRDFEDRVLEAEVIKRIIAAGLQAPSNDHMRNWEFVIVNDKETRKKLLHPVARAEYSREATVSSPGTEAYAAEVIDTWGLTDARQRDMFLYSLPKQYAMLYSAGCLILPFFRYEGALLRPASLIGLSSFASIWCCIENMLIAAAAEGIFGVTRIPLGNEPEHIKGVIGHPDNYIMPCYLALGYPAKKAVRTAQNEVSVADKMHNNAW